MYLRVLSRIEPLDRFAIWLTSASIYAIRSQPQIYRVRILYVRQYAPTPPELLRWLKYS